LAAEAEKRRVMPIHSKPQFKQSEDNIIAIGKMDYTILLVVLILVLFGLVMIFSASYYTASINKDYHYDMFFFVRKQALFAVAGFAFMIIVSNINYNMLRRLALPIYGTAVLLLIYVFFFGVAVNGARRWITLPIVGSFQPSELMKVGTILVLSLLISTRKDILKKWPGFIFCCGVVGFGAFFVFIENFSTSLIICVIGIGIIFVASSYIMRFVVAGASAVSLLVVYLAFFSKGFRGDRFDAWLHPFDDPSNTAYQAVQSLYAIASGGMFGLGLGQSRQKSFIPEAHNDIIFSIVCEELGFVGACIVIILFGVLIWRGIRVALRAPDTFGSLVAAGVVIMIAAQTIINIAVVTNSIPNTGVPLPFISYGGTALMIMLGLVGVLLNISRYSKY